jgi:hypothetical protein
LQPDVQNFFKVFDRNAGRVEEEILRKGSYIDLSAVRPSSRWQAQLGAGVRF